MAATEEIITISQAQAPFDDHNCDIILRSADGVDFHVYKLILSLVSPIFKDMFTLPQSESQSDISSVPIIDVMEGSTTLESLLLLCYPAAATPTFHSLDDAKVVMKAASKYDIQAALSRAGDLVMAQFFPNHFLELYALSCQFGWQRHAQTAATRALEIKDLGRPSNGFHGLQDISGADYHRLLVYHYRCGVIAQNVGSSLSWLESLSHMAAVRDGCYKCGTIYMKQHLKVASWFNEYLVSSGKELLARPCESTLWELSHYNRAIIKATECAECRKTVFENMKKFHTLYTAQVKKVVATVSQALSATP
ncbi:uncharacterized protein F5147DRAFT_706651 [Suillus discolor]|uniref:BTB domain-containing protein n=1 Tax=Suillus discolor TaxID=1912936 RepID=A0A9P7F258_9AGAM|nr:uncharacterized protein F5147DRAFT_706651 [Suillus discolor]KAG2103128.1 hypothetical protein F5147DRAFT_706651 [Suillus discolor]